MPFLQKFQLKLRRRKEIRKEGQIDILDENGALIGETTDIYDLHERKLWHRTANVYIVNSHGEVLVQQRAKTMRVFPGMWQAAHGGHIPAGKTSIETAIQEVKEELGVAVNPSELVTLVATKKEEVQLEGKIMDREFHDNFILFKDIPIANIRMQKHEVGAVRYIPIEEYHSLIISEHPDHVLHPSLVAFFNYIDSHGAAKN